MYGPLIEVWNREVLDLFNVRSLNLNPTGDPEGC